MLHLHNRSFFKLRKLLTASTSLIILFSLSACSIFNQEAEEARLPAELKKINPSLSVNTVWKTSIGDDAEKLGYGLQVASNGDSLFLAGANGVVRALEANTGKLKWSIATGTVLSAGPSVGADRVLVASNNGDVIALNSENGEELWRTSVSGEVITPAGVGPDHVAVRSANGTLHVLSASSGAPLWFDEQTVPTLSLRGSSSPVVIGGVI